MSIIILLLIRQEKTARLILFARLVVANCNLLSNRDNTEMPNLARSPNQ